MEEAGSIGTKHSGVFTVAICAIGGIIMKAVLAVIYFVILTPVGLVKRLMGKDPMARHLDKDAQSYWIKRSNMSPTKKDMERQF